MKIWTLKTYKSIKDFIGDDYYKVRRREISRGIN